MPLSIQVHERVPANLMLGVTLRWTNIPSRGELKYSYSLHATETVISSLGSYADFTLPYASSTEYDIISPRHLNLSLLSEVLNILIKMAMGFSGSSRCHSLPRFTYSRQQNPRSCPLKLQLKYSEQMSDLGKK